MPRESTERRLARALGIIMDYDGAGRVPIEELVSRFACTRAAIERDLAVLGQCGIPPYEFYDQLITAEVDDDGMVEVHVPHDFARRARLTGGEGVALLTAAATVLVLRPDDEALARAVEQLAEQLGIGRDLQIVLDRPPCLAALLDAHDGRRVVAGRYWSAHRDAVEDRVLEPHAVFFGGGAWYARCRDRSLPPARASRRVEADLKLFRADRFESVSVTDEVFERLDLDESLALFHPGARAETVTVHFPPEAAWVAESLQVRVLERDDDGMTAALEVVGTAWLENLLLRTGGRVVDPPELRDLGPAAARRALSRYR